MVNNHHREADLHPPLFFMTLVLAAILCASGFSAAAQNIKKYYVSFNQEQGTLFFIRPQKGFKSKQPPGRLVFDITCVSGADSLTLNLSYFDKTSRTPDSLTLLTASKRSVSGLQKIFIDTKGSAWHYRFSSRFSIQEVEAFFNTSHGALIQIVDRNTTITFQCKQKKWKKLSSINQKIFQLIRYNS